MFYGFPLWFWLLTSMWVGWHSCRVMLTTTTEWGALVTKLNVPADWKGLSLSLSLSIYIYIYRCVCVPLEF